MYLDEGVWQILLICVQTSYSDFDHCTLPLLSRHSGSSVEYEGRDLHVQTLAQSDNEVIALGKHLHGVLVRRVGGNLLQATEKDQPKRHIPRVQQLISAGGAAYRTEGLAHNNLAEYCILASRLYIGGLQSVIIFRIQSVSR